MLNRLRRSLRSRGALGTLKLAARATASVVVRKRTERVLAKELSADADGVRPGQLDIVLVTGADSPLPATMPPAFTGDRQLMSVFRSYLTNGFGGVFAEIDGTAVGYLWWTKRTGPRHGNHPQLVRFNVELANDDLWIFDLNILREHRRTSSEFLTRAESLAKDHGFRRIMFCVAADNRPALWLYHRWGWKAVDAVEMIEILRCVLISRHGVFLRNAPWSKRQGFDYRALWRTRASQARGAAHARGDASEHALPSTVSGASHLAETRHAAVVDTTAPIHRHR